MNPNLYCCGLCACVCVSRLETVNGSVVKRIELEKKMRMLKVCLCENLGRDEHFKVTSESEKGRFILFLLFRTQHRILCQTVSDKKSV